MTFLLSQDREISYGTTKIQKKILPCTQNLCQIHNIQYIKLKENSNFKILTDILSGWQDFFLNYCGTI